MTELDLFGKKESARFVAETVLLHLDKNYFNDELLKCVKELQEHINKMTLEEYEEYARRVKAFEMRRKIRASTTLIREKPQGLSEEK